MIFLYTLMIYIIAIVHFKNIAHVGNIQNKVKSYNNSIVKS